jgi:hypothetical protein
MPATRHARIYDTAIRRHRHPSHRRLDRWIAIPEHCRETIKCFCGRRDAGYGSIVCDPEEEGSATAVGKAGTLTHQLICRIRKVDFILKSLSFVLSRKRKDVFTRELFGHGWKNIIIAQLAFRNHHRRVARAECDSP